VKQLEGPNIRADYLNQGGGGGKNTCVTPGQKKWGNTTLSVLKFGTHGDQDFPLTSQYAEVSEGPWRRVKNMADNGPSDHSYKQKREEEERVWGNYDRSERKGGGTPRTRAGEDTEVKGRREGKRLKAELRGTLRGYWVRSKVGWGAMVVRIK